METLIHRIYQQHKGVSSKKRQRKPKGQSRMYRPETQGTCVHKTQNEHKQNKNNTENVKGY
jgi:hypothetical protein